MSRTDSRVHTALAPLAPALQTVPRILRVVLTGAESTGKTTLARALAAHYQTAWVPEYVRHFVEVEGRVPGETDTVQIARGHLAQAQRSLPRARRVLFLDTDLVSTCLYHRYYFGGEAPWVEEQAVRHRADLYLFLMPDIPWVPDPGQRESPKVRALLHDLFADAIRPLPHAMVAGSCKQRFQTAVTQVDRLLNAASATVPTADPSHTGTPHGTATTPA